MAAVNQEETPLYFLPISGKKNGAYDRSRTDDLFLTKEVLYQLSYIGILNFDVPYYTAFFSIFK